MKAVSSRETPSINEEFILLDKSLRGLSELTKRLVSSDHSSLTGAESSLRKLDELLSKLLSASSPDDQIVGTPNPPEGDEETQKLIATWTDNAQQLQATIQRIKNEDLFEGLMSKQLMDLETVLDQVMTEIQTTAEEILRSPVNARFIYGVFLISTIIAFIGEILQYTVQSQYEVGSTAFWDFLVAVLGRNLAEVMLGQLSDLSGPFFWLSEEIIFNEHIRGKDEIKSLTVDSFAKRAASKGFSLALYYAIHDLFTSQTIDGSDALIFSVPIITYVAWSVVKLFHDLEDAPDQTVTETQ